MTNIKYINNSSNSLIDTLEEIINPNDRNFDTYSVERIDRIFFQVLTSPTFPLIRKPEIQQYYLRVNSIIIIESYSLYVF